MKRDSEPHLTTTIRIPPELHKSVHLLAVAETRSFNGQILAMLKEAAQSKQLQGAAQ